MVLSITADRLFLYVFKMKRKGMIKLKHAIKIGSNTLALRGCELLRQQGIPCTVSRLSDPNGKYGCLYTISVEESQQWNAERILRSSGIMVLP